MTYGELEHGLPAFKPSTRSQVCKQEPLASDDSHLSEDSKAEVHLDLGMLLLLEACEKLAEEECTAETKPPTTRRSAPKRNYAAVDYSEGNIKAESKSQKASSSSKRRSRTELHGPCCHCGVMESPQWRKGPLCKPVLCNACGTRFLRTRSLGKIVMGRNGRRYTKEATPEAEACCENSTGSTDDIHPPNPPACPTRRDSRLGLSRPSKTRRLDSPSSTRAPSTRRRTAALQSPPTKPPSRAAPPGPRPATSATSASTNDDSSSLLHVSATLSRLAALPPSTDAAAVALLKRLLGPATSAPAPTAFVLPPVPLLNMGLAPPPSTPAHPTRYSQQRLQQQQQQQQQRHQQAVQQLQQQQMQAAKAPASAASRAGKVPIYLHVQAGLMPVL